VYTLIIPVATPSSYCSPLDNTNTCLLATAEHCDFPATRLQPLVDQQRADSGDQVAYPGGCGLEVHLHNPVAS